MALISSCDKCEDEIVCTQEFRSITIRLDNGTQMPVTLDEVYTLRQGSTQKIIFTQPFTNGQYIVLDDSYHSSLKNQEADFRFIGVKSNQVVVDQTFKIRGDDCHVYKVSGPDNVLVP